MAGSESEKKCELCLYPAHLQCKCGSDPVFVCPSCVLRHIRKEPEGVHRFFPLDEAMAEAESQRAKGKSKGTVKAKVEEEAPAPVCAVVQPAPAQVCVVSQPEGKRRTPIVVEMKPCTQQREEKPCIQQREEKPCAPVKTEKEGTRVYTCPLCKAVLKNFLTYKGHMKQHVTQ